MVETEHRKELTARADIDLLVKQFYEQAIADKLIGHFFTEVKQLNFDHHIPLICDFWEGILFGATLYQGNPMLKHLELNQLAQLEAQHFERWLMLWEKTVEANFYGEKAQAAISRARQIAALMQYKIKSTS